MRRLLYSLLSTLLLLGFSDAAAQNNYQSALGVRLGRPLSVSYKFFLDGSNRAVELYSGFRPFRRYRWFSVNGAYLVHNEVEEVNRLLWYYGGGAGIQFWNYDFDNDFGRTSLSVSGYLGLEYTFRDEPFSLSLDWVPTLFLGTFDDDYRSLGYGYGSLGIRLLLDR